MHAIVIMVLILELINCVPWAPCYMKYLFLHVVIIWPKKVKSAKKKTNNSWSFIYICNSRWKPARSDMWVWQWKNFNTTTAVKWSVKTNQTTVALNCDITNLAILTRFTTCDALLHGTWMKLSSPETRICSGSVKGVNWALVWLPHVLHSPSDSLQWQVKKVSSQHLAWWG